MRGWSLRDALGADSAVHKRGNGARFEGVLGKKGEGVNLKGV